MPHELLKLVEVAKTLPKMTDAEREEQARNFAAGNVGLENPRVTRAVVDVAVQNTVRSR